MAAMSALPQLSAAALYWDADATNNGAYGGDGTWETGNSQNWAPDTTGTDPNMSWAATGDRAIFLRGTTGTVSVAAGGVSAAYVEFGLSVAPFTSGSTAYTIEGGRIALTTGDNSTGLKITQGAVTFNNGVDFSTSVRIQGSADFAGGLRFTGSSSRTLTVFTSGSMNFGAITKSGSTNASLTVGGTSGSDTATYTLNASNTGISNVTLNKGSLVVNNSGALGATGTFTFSNGGAGERTQKLLIGTAGVTISKSISYGTGTNNASDTRTLGSNMTSGTATFTGAINIRSGDGISTRVTAAAGGTTVFSGLIDDSTETIGILKEGAGIVKFTRAAGNTYGGNTTVSAGALIINNVSTAEALTSGTGEGNVSVSNGAVFGGNGRSSGAVTLAAGGGMSPGDMDEAGVSQAGTFTAGSLTWNSSDLVGMSFNLGVDQASSDQLIVEGAFTKGTGSTFVFDFTGSTLNESITYALVTFGSNNGFTVDDFSAIGGDDAFAFGFVGDTLVYSAVPEPSTYAAFAGVLALAGAVWRKRRTA